MIKEYKNVLILIIGTLTLALALVLTLTRPAFDPFFDFSNTGPIGDTIGGITAPLFNLLGAILIYLSFKEQFKANKIQINALNSTREFSNLESLINQISNEVDSLEFKYTIKSTSSNPKVANTEKEFEFHGLSAIYVFSNKVEQWKEGDQLRKFANSLIYILDIIEFTYNKIDSFKYSNADRKYLKYRLLHYWDFKLGLSLLEVCKVFSMQSFSRNEQYKNLASLLHYKISNLSKILEEVRDKQ